jgi:adenine-specific DNA-methyltransferase
MTDELGIISAHMRVCCTSQWGKEKVFNAIHSIERSQSPLEQKHVSIWVDEDPNGGKCDLPRASRELTVEGGLHPLSLKYMLDVGKDKRKTMGQFFTPRTLRDRLLDHVELRAGMRVLDPGVGTGEFLRSCADRQDGMDLVGWDVDACVASVARQVCPEAAIRVCDALEEDGCGRFDLVIGNPPYFHVRSSVDMRARFGAVISGRPNIFALFIHVALGQLREGGQLAFVVPPSMNNGRYFQSLRDHMCDVASIEYLEVITDNRWFVGAQTPVQLIVLRKGPGSDKHIFRWGRSDDLFGATVGRSIFSEDPYSLGVLFHGRRTLQQVGYEAITGSIVWNQNKDKLRRSTEKGAVPLIWAHNIQNGKLVLDDGHKRPQYVVTDKQLMGPAIVVNRITGRVGSGQLRAALIPNGMEYVAENHVNVIRRVRGSEIGEPDILKALIDPAVHGRIQMLTGNTQVSATELTHLLPLDVSVNGSILDSDELREEPYPRGGKYDHCILESVQNGLVYFRTLKDDSLHAMPMCRIRLIRERKQ